MDDDDDDLYRQCCKLYVLANTLACKFSDCSIQVKVALFKAYCTPLLWITKSSLQRLQEVYIDVVRVLLKVPKGGSATQMFVSAGVSTSK